MSVSQLAIYGLGRAGRALAEACVQNGLPLGAVGIRSHESGGADFSDAPLYIGLADFLTHLEAGCIVILAVRDDAIVDVAEQAAQELPSLEHGSEIRFCHMSGSMGTQPLEPLIRAGAPCGVFHLLQSFPETGGEALIPRSYVGIAGEASLVSDLLDLARALKCVPFTLQDDQRSAYHAAAVLASNALVSLLASARDVLIEAGLDSELAGKMLLPLVQGTLSNMERTSAEEAFTGPVVRGDAGTIRRHLDVLKGDARRTYVSTVRAGVSLARRSGRTPTDRLDEILKLLEEEE